MPVEMQYLKNYYLKNKVEQWLRQRLGFWSIHYLKVYLGIYWTVKAISAPVFWDELKAREGGWIAQNPQHEIVGTEREGKKVMPLSSLWEFVPGDQTINKSFNAFAIDMVYGNCYLHHFAISFYSTPSKQTTWDHAAIHFDAEYPLHSTVVWQMYG